MPISVIEAVKMGHWDFEPADQDASAFRATKAMPGTDEKLDVMAGACGRECRCGIRRIAGLTTPRRRLD